MTIGLYALPRRRGDPLRARRRRRPHAAERDRGALRARADPERRGHQLRRVQPLLVAGPLDGQIFTIFIIILAAAEAATILAIVLNIYHALNTVKVDEVDSMKE